MKTVIEHMRSLCPISDETVEELMKCVTLCHFPKRYQLIQENRFCKYAYFIEKGMTRSFWLVDGEEITTSFSCEGGIVFSMDELYYQKKSEEFVETLEEVEAYRIALTDLIRLFETNLEFCNWGRIIHQNEYRRLHRSHKERLTLPAKERYEEFQKQFPYVCQRTNLGFIASYLGITLSTLSRIRSASDNNS
ncbi:Crp/Fnr family transcriptional regulator [Phocaeicola barnesiae]|uniref:Crp/Fnr family transcriptional regulator n=1 Tax=Phocaeicola barnesiae TaxID=376804 RepID=A0AAW5N7P1_9BACT|nr:Crp/Fnr family transcriptional regulator [Phocaeicola barnesiae]CDD33067.1 cyclic nucleotide-binding domain protein [Bacteroides sp. CAG:714]MCF2575467.1 Crp/Fnr family transcriptional regulator [Phocaeicola barnesiae]MCF2598614.1 Crp/Fnr family transcriptional regulator [Phocaeicola barnesiae]MCR8873210.1 Crp/Fnr family transcriptional regulator [Phocaeicola barnesiae]MDM8234302.1 Crp/Fnr family transcriptional regulator [Phocaeicola barnesiae]